MDTIIERCAGLDIGKKTLTACVRAPDGKGGRRSQTRTFSTMTRRLLVLRDWLASERVTVVSMESTSTYWKAPFSLIEDDVEVWLLGRAPSHDRARPQDRREGRGMDRAVDRVRAGPRLVRAAHTDPPAA
jgi:transposase